MPKKNVFAAILNIPLTVKVSISYAICNILQKCLSFITLPLFARLLTTEQYGQYTIYQSWMGIVSIFLTLNLAYGSFSTAMVKFENDRDAYISSVQGILIGLSGLFLIIYLPVRNFWNALFRLPTTLVLMMILEVIFTTGQQFWIGKKRFEFKYKSVILVTMIQSLLSPLLAFCLVQNTVEKGYARILGYSLVAIIIGGLFFFNNWYKGKCIFIKKYWIYALRFNLPLIAYYLSQVIFNQSDRIMISHFCGEGSAAMYGVAYNLAIMMTFILNAINNSYVPWFYEKIKTGETKENQKVTCGIAIIMAFLLLCIIWYAPEIIKIMAGTKYTPAIGVVAPVAMSLLLLFYVQLFINVEFYYEEKKLLVISSIGSAIVNVVLNALLIPRFSFVAAGYTTLLSYILFVICNYFAMKRTLNKHNQKDEAYHLKGLTAIFCVFIASGFLGVALYGLFVLRLSITIVVLLAFLRYRKLLINIIRTIKN